MEIEKTYNDLKKQEVFSFDQKLITRYNQLSLLLDLSTYIIEKGELKDKVRLYQIMNYNCIERVKDIYDSVYKRNNTHIEREVNSNDEKEDSLYRRVRFIDDEDT